MGSTVVTNRAATAFKSAAGETVWCLFEKLYDSNTRPHTPEWRCVSIGDTKATVKAVFDMASYCEGGMLRSPKGGLLPEDYIERWLKAMRNPIKMHDLQIQVGLPKDRADWGQHWAEEERQTNAAAVSRLRAIGRDGEATALEGGETLTWSLHGDAALVCAVFSDGGLAPWRAIGRTKVPPLDSQAFKADRAPELRYRPAQASDIRSPEIPNLCRIDHQELLVESEGQWNAAGWDYSILGRYVKELWQEELRTPGGYRSKIEAYREAVEGAPLVRPGTVALVDLTVLDESRRVSVEQIARETGGEVSESVARVPWSEPTSPYAPNPLRFLPGDSITWQVVLDDGRSLEAGLAHGDEDETSRGVSR